MIRLPVLFFGVFLATFLWIGGQAQEKEKSNTSEKNLTFSFFTDQMTLWLYHTQIIPVQLAEPATDLVSITLVAESPEKIEIIKQPQILPGETIGYCRVKTKQAGKTILSLTHKEQSTTLQVEIRPTVWDPEQNLKKPLITGLVPNAVVWGTFSVGVEVFHDPVRTEEPVLVKLYLPDGSWIQPKESRRFFHGPFQHLLFEVNANDLPVGFGTFFAKAQYGEQTLESDPVSVLIQHPAEEDIIRGECEDHIIGPRPKRYGEVHPKLGSSPEASQEKFVLNYSANPAWCLPIEVKEPGLYQMALVTRGDFAGGSFPTIGLFIDEAFRATTTIQLVHNQWHRLLLGHPISLEAGSHFLTAFFMNDFYVQALSDRNVYLDRYELLPLQSLNSKESSTSMMMNGMSMEDTMMNATGAMASYSGGSEVKVVFNTTVLDRKPVGGMLTFNGICSWGDMEKKPTPQVTLFINNRPYSSQQSGDPLFWVDRSAFSQGMNTVKLRAQLPSGVTSWSAPQEILIEDTLNQGERSREFYRFMVEDTPWEPGLEKMFTKQGRDRVALFSTNGRAVLNLPEELQGTFDIYVDGRGSEFQGWAEATLFVRVQNNEKEISKMAMTGGFAPRKMGTYTFEAGSKQLAVAFLNDQYEKDKGDRNLWIRSVILQEIRTETDQTPPQVTLHYPQSEQTVYHADVVVASAIDNESISYADLVVDGEIQLMNATLPYGAGYFVFPLLLRQLQPGPHRVKIRVWDRYGNIGESKEVSITVTEKAPLVSNTYARAVRLLKRFAYGTESQEMAKLLILGEKEWLTQHLGRSIAHSSEQVAFEHADFVYPNKEAASHAIHRALRHLLLTDNPARFRFVLWSQNHFSTWLQKANAWSKWEEFSSFLSAGVAPFGDLLFTSATSPAMLLYLDQFRSFAYRLNENYAREIMELHTLGVQGGYTQSDVTTLATLLTGWTYSDEGDSEGNGYPLMRRFRFDPRLNDDQEKQFFGLNFPSAPPDQRHDQIRLALEMLAAHPATAEFICRKIIHHYVAIPAPEGLLKDLTTRFLANGGDFQDLLLAISEHDAFWKTDLPPRLTTPLEFTTSVLRICGNLSNGWVGDCMSNSGVALFDCVTPDGYPEENDAYASSNALLQRWRFAKLAGNPIFALLPPPWRTMPKTEIAEWRQKVIDFLAIRLTGFPLSEASNMAALESLTNTQALGAQALIEVATFICQLPEVHFR